MTHGYETDNDGFAYILAEPERRAEVRRRLLGYEREAGERMARLVAADEAGRRREQARGDRADFSVVLALLAAFLVAATCYGAICPTN